MKIPALGERIPVHLRLAEKGKMFSLAGDHGEALRYYREALKLATQQNAAEIFSLHYTQCAMESLELMGEFTLVKEYCTEFCNNLDKNGCSTAIAQKHYASLLERKGVQHLFLGENEEAKTAFAEAQEKTGKGKQALTDELLNWIQRGYRIQPLQIRQLQDRHRYFSVRKDKLNPVIAIDLPVTNDGRLPNQSPKIKS
jgi:tetratricopeptide (TPR) repeat protein